MRKGLLISIALVLLANAATLALVALNRNGEEATLVLTEREMRLSPAGIENTAVTLSLEWRHPRSIRQDVQWNWFDRAKLEDVGFDCSVAPDAPGAREHYQRQAMVPRAAFVVLEYRPDLVPDAVEFLAPFDEPGGPRQVTEEERRRLPRLVAVDVGRDAAQLRAQYPDRNRFVILHGTAQMIHRPSSPVLPSPVLRGSVTMVYPVEIYVPKEHRAILEALRPKEGEEDRWATLPHDPRYEVTVTWGSRLEPRVTGVRRLPSPSDQE